MRAIWETLLEAYGEWQRHRCAQLAAALGLYGVIAFAGIALVAIYVAAAHASTRAQFSSQVRHTGGAADAQMLRRLLDAGAAQHDAWIALAAGVLLFVAASAISALLLQDGLNALWDVDVRTRHRREPARSAARHLPQFAVMLLFSFVLLILLFAGAAIDALANRTHRLSLLSALGLQAADFIVAVAVLTLVFLCIFAWLAPVRSSWRKVWLASVVSGVLYERGQFGLALYVGQMDRRSPYADVGALAAIVLWLLYSAEVVYAGAVLTKVLSRREDRARKRS